MLLAAKFIGEIAGIDRFSTDAQLARLAGCASIPVSCGRSDRFRLDPGGNRRLNSAFYMLRSSGCATTPAPPSTSKNSAPTARTRKEAIRSLKRHLVRRVYHLLHDPQNVPTTICFDIEDSRILGTLTAHFFAVRDHRFGPIAAVGASPAIRFRAAHVNHS